MGPYLGKKALLEGGIPSRDLSPKSPCPHVSTCPRRMRHPVPQAVPTQSGLSAQSRLPRPPIEGVGPVKRVAPGFSPDLTSLEVDGDPALRHTCFDPVLGERHRRRMQDWTEWVCLTDCVGASSYIPMVAGRTMRYHVNGVPIPQTMVVTGRTARTHRPFVLDMRAWDVPLTVLEPLLGSTLVEAMVPFYHANWPPQFRLHLMRNIFEIRANGALIDAQSILPPDVDVVVVRPNGHGGAPLHDETSSSSAANAAPPQVQGPGQVPPFAQPPVPPVPQPRWNRRFKQSQVDEPHDALSSGTVCSIVDHEVPVTVYDQIMHVRVLHAPPHLSPEALVQWAIMHSPFLPEEVQGTILQHVHEQFPCPQILLAAPQKEDTVVVPIIMEAGDTQVCTVAFPVRHSAFELAIAIGGACFQEDSLRFQVARQVATTSANHFRVPAFEAGRLAGAEVIAFTGVQRGWKPNPQSAVRQLQLPDDRPSMGRRISPQQLLRKGTCPSYSVFAHSPAGDMREVPVDPLWRPATLRQQILTQCGLDTDAVVKFLPFSPHFQGANVHAIVLPRLALQQHRHWTLVDTRRMSRSSAPFFALPVPARMSNTYACRAVAEAWPEVGPLGFLFLDGDPFEDRWMAMPTASLLTLLPVAHVNMRPAMAFSMDILEQGIGYASAFLQAGPTRLEGHVRSAANTTISTTAMPPPVPHGRRIQVDLPVFEGPERPNPMEDVAFIVASAQCPPGGFKTHYSVDIPEVAAKLLHYITRHAFVAAMPLLGFHPRVFCSPARRHIVFATVGSESESVPYIWVDAMPFLPAPVFQMAAAPSCLYTLLYNAGLRQMPTIYATVNGAFWDGTARQFQFGDVVQVRATLEALVSFSPDSSRYRLTHSCAMVFPVFGPLMRFYSYKLRITPAEAYKSFTREALYTHFRAVYTRIVRTVYSPGGACLMLVGPDIAPVRIATGCQQEPPIQTAQSFYADIWSQRLGERVVVSLHHQLDSVWLFAALPRTFSGTLWLYKSYDGLTWVQDDATGSGLASCPLMDGTCLVPTASFGAIGIADHQVPQMPRPCLVQCQPRIVADNDGVEELSLLQLSTHTRKQPVPHRTTQTEPATVRFQVWSANHASFQLCVPCDASFDDVAIIASEQEQRQVLPACFVPVFPVHSPAIEFIECQSGGSSIPMLVRFWEGRWPSVLLWDHAPTVWDLEVACACGRLDFFLGDTLWQGPQDGFLPGMCLSARHRLDRPPHRLAFRISLSAALESACEKGLQTASSLRGLLQTASTFQWPLTRMHCMGHHKPAVKAALASALQVPFGHQMVQCVVYTDGSYQPHPCRIAAGASFNVWFAEHQPAFFAGSFACPAHVPESSVKEAPFLAECTAMQMALIWTFSLPAHVRVRLCFDCQRAGYAADGRWHCSGTDPTALQACQSLRSLFLLAQQVRPIIAQHTKAHAGNLPNELADAAAKAAALGAFCMDIPQHAAALLSHDSLPWAWAVFAREPDGLPALDLLMARRAPAPTPPTQEELSCGVIDVHLHPRLLLRKSLVVES